MTIRLPATIALIGLLFISMNTIQGVPAGDPVDTCINSIDPTTDAVLIENLGQLEDDTIKFYTMGQFRAALGSDLIRYSLERKIDDEELRTDCWQVEFVESLSVVPEGMGQISTSYNFFYGDTQITGARGYEAVFYEELYPNIDMIYHFSGNDLKYDLILKPGSDPANIMLSVSGQVSLHIEDNELVIELGDGTLVREKGLKVFYEDTQEAIAASFELIDDSTFTFSLEDYDRTRTVVIDPLVFSTWVGGLGSDQGYGMTVDGDGNSYVTGATTAREFPVTVGAYSTEWQGSQDVFLFKMNNDGTDILFCTLIGGSREEIGMVVHLDDSGNIYLSGRVASSDFPTTNNAYDRSYSDLYDVFVCKFNPAASSLLFSTYVGGESSEWPQNIITDNSNNIIVGGIVNGDGFPTTTGAMKGSYGGGDIDGFLFKMNPQGSSLVYSTYVGGDQDDRVTGLVLDDEGYAYISGYTRSSDFPITSGAYDTTRDGSSDAYIMKVANDGTAPIYSTLFGGTLSDGIYDLKMTSDGDLVFTGITYSTDLPTTSGVSNMTSIGAGDIFLTRMDINCTIVKQCTYLGSDGYEKPTFMTLDPMDRITIMGITSSANFPTTPDAVNSTNQGSSDSFLLTVLADWSGIQYGTYLGGGLFDVEGGVGTDDKGRIYAAGSTDNENFPTTTGSFDPVNNGFEDVYVLSISLDTPPTPPLDLQAHAGDGFVNLSWNTPANPGSLDLIGYDINKGEISLGETKFATVGDILHFNDTDVENGRTYFYNVRAKNLALDSVPSPEVQATPLGVPSTPMNLQCTGGFMKVDISWRAPDKNGGTPILGFNLFRTDGLEEVTIPLPSGSVSYKDEDVTSGVEYSYSIEAFNVVGASPRSFSSTAIPVSQPSSPMNLTLRSGDGFVEISWKAPASNGGMLLREYNIYRSVSGGESLLLKNLHYSLLKYNDTTVHNGVDYTYQVTAVNIVGESAPTEMSTIKPTTVPSSPLKFKVFEGDGEVRLTWERPLTDGGSEILEYSIKRTLVDGEGTITISVNGEEDQYVDTDVENGLTYRYSISAGNERGMSLASSELQATPASIPGDPEVTVISIGEDHVLLGWEAPLDIGGAEILSYEVHKGPNPSEMVIVKTFGAGTFRYNDTDVIPGTTYHYAIRAINQIGSSQAYETIEARPIGRPSAPTGISIDKLDGKLEVSWSEPTSNGGSEIVGYSLLRRESDSGDEDAFDVSSDELSYLDDSVTPGMEYQYSVAAVNELGHGAVSAVVESYAFRSPGQVQGLSASYKDGEVDISWAPLDLSETGDVVIEVRRSIGTDGPVTIAILEGTETGYRDTNIRSGIVYSYNLLISNDVGSSSSSEKKEVDTTIVGSDGISGAGISILIIGTILPLIIAVILLLFVFRNRKKEEPEVTGMPPPEPSQETIITAPMGEPEAVSGPEPEMLLPPSQQYQQFEPVESPISMEHFDGSEMTEMKDRSFLDDLLSDPPEPMEESIPDEEPVVEKEVIS